MEKPLVMDENAIKRTLIRLSHEIMEKNENMDEVVLLGIKRGGEVVANRICEYFKTKENLVVPCAGIDIGMFRDDLASQFLLPQATVNHFPFSLEGKTVVLCDDILNTGRTVRAAIEAIFSLGRPKKLQLLILADRGGREIPVQADYVGKNIPTEFYEYVKVSFKELGEEFDSISILEKQVKENA